MTLDDLMGAAGGTGDDQPPCPILIDSFDVSTPQTPPAAMLSFLGYSTIAFPVGERSRAREVTAQPNNLGITVMALRTGGEQGADDSDDVMKEPVVVAVVQLAMDFDATQWQTGSISVGLVTVPTVQLIYTSEKLDRDQVGIVNARIEKSGVDGLPQLPVPPLGGCLDRWIGNVAFTVGNTVLPLQVSWHDRDGYDLPPAGELEAGSLLRPPGDRTQEGFSRTIGPLRFSGVGLGIADCKLRITVNVELALGPLWLGLYEVGWWVSLDGSLEHGPTWSGAGLDFPVWHPPMPYPPLRLQVALARISQPGMRVSLAGLGLLEVKALLTLFLTGYFGINVDGWVSAFGFAEVTLPENAVGIPGLIVLKSISLGAGGNSTMRVPTAKDVSSFPLVRRLGLEPGEGEGPPGLIAAIQALNELAGEGGWVTPAQGQYWIALGAGLSLIGGFVETNALIVAEFGGSSQKLMVIGTATFTFPKVPAPDKKVIAKLVLDLAISLQWHPAIIFTLDVAIGDGSFFWDERITPTGGLSVYVQDRSYPLGVAFSLGGYHPQYVPPARPAYYPVPPRAGFNVQYSPGLTVRGQGYLAVTANAFQRGMSATWLFSLGNKDGVFSLEAWLGFYFDILVQWNPFYLDASGGFRAGFAATVKIWFVRVRISVEISLQVQFWTPPFGGRFGAKLWFITIEVPFGAPRAGAPPVDWGEFWAMLPEPMSVQPETGVELQGVVPLPDQRAVARTGSREQPILGSAKGFSCTTQAALSVNRITLNGSEFIAIGTPAAIRPMRLRQVDSIHHVTVTRNGTPYNPLGDPDPARRWEVEALRQDVPAAQWGEPVTNANQELTRPATVPGRLAGLRLTIPEPGYSQQSLGPVSAVALAVEPVLPDGLIALRDPAVAGPRAYADPGSVVLIAETVEAKAPARTAVYAQLLDAGVALTPDGDQSLAEYQRRIDNMFTAAPLLTGATAERDVVTGR
jgi:hypothetical protein